MAAEIVKTCTEILMELRLIGKRYYAPEHFVANWGEWFEKGWFEQIRKQGVASENKDVYLGVTPPGAPCYWIGLLFPPGPSVPDGFDYVDIPALKYTVFEFDGKKEWELFGEDGVNLCLERMREYKVNIPENGWCIERYSFTGRKGIVLFEAMWSIE